MKTQNSTRNTKGVSNENKNQVNNNAANSPKRVVVTRDEYTVVYDHAVSLVVAYSCGHKVEDPRKGFAFGPASNGSHTRNYAKSLIWGFATNKALKGLKAQDGKKDLKVLDELTDKAKRVKIAIAILTDCSLVKGDSKAIEASLNKVEPKRERVFAESVLAGLMAEETKAATPKGSKAKGETKKSATPKGSKDTKSETKATAPKGSKAKGQTKAAPKGAKANGKAKAGK
jgi:hypothetical protein